MVPARTLSAHRVTLVIAPHLDDAVLSCGGQLAELTASGGRVVVVTTFTGSPAASRLSDFARAFHRSCGLADDSAVVERRREDVIALARLSAEHCHLGFEDAVYRPGVVDEEQDLFTAATDPDLVVAVERKVRALVKRLRPTALYCPLAIGDHVDHRIVRSAVDRIPSVPIAYYEDIPYAIGAAVGGSDGHATLHVVDALNWQRKLDAVSCYVSQVRLLWGCARRMRTEVTAHARVVGGGRYAERSWIA